MGIIITLCFPKTLRLYLCVDDGARVISEHVVEQLVVDAEPLASGYPALQVRLVRARLFVVGHVPDSDQLVAPEQVVRARHFNRGRDLGQFDYRRRPTAAGIWRHGRPAHRAPVGHVRFP